MTKPPLSTTISSLLVCSMIVTPTLSFAQSASVQSAAERERLRRYDYERRGEQALTAGAKAMKDKDYESATANYKNASDMIPNARNTQALYKRAINGFCDASVKLAEQRIAEGRYDQAEFVLRVVTEERYMPDCKPALQILANLESPDYYNKTIGPRFVASVEQVKQFFVEAQGFYEAGRYTLALKRCEQILNIDPYNKAARRFQEKVEGAMSDYGVTAYNHTRANAMRQVDLAWQRPIRRFNTPILFPEGGERIEANRTEKIQKKLSEIIIPRLEFREATIREAVEYLKKKSFELDVNSPPGDRGVNIVLRLDAGTSGGAPEQFPAAPPAIPGLGDPLAPAPGAAPIPGFSPSDARITVSLSNIPLGEALRYVTGLANLKFKVEPFAVSIVPQSVNTDILITKEWKVRPDLIPRTGPGGGGAPSGFAAPAFGAGGGTTDRTTGGSGIADRESAKAWLITNGVQFNGAASAIYIVGSSRLIVRNTQDQLDLIDTIIQSVGQGGPTQISIEAKFVEITQNNLKELSFDWLVGAFNLNSGESVFGSGGTAGTSAGVNPLDFPFVQPGGTAVGSNLVTGGTRSGATAISANAIDALLFGGAGNSLLSPAIGALSGVFTDPQFQVVIRALNQKKGVDLLSAPSVTTKSGQRAVIEIIREFRYPTEFDPPQIPQTFGRSGNVSLVPGAISGGESNAFPVTPTTPTAFETRNTGVTLEVEPVVGPDGYTIDLNLVPQVVEFEGFINYGSPIQTTSTNILGVTTTQVLTPNIINQPIFSTRKVTTSVSVFDGSTVVLGGLMREDIQKVEDKVPLLGDIPIIGRLFRSSVDQHLKRNLVIFVTARLMNPAGEAVRLDDEKEEVIEVLTFPEEVIELPLMPK